MKFNLKNFPKRDDYPNVSAGVTEPYNKAVEAIGKWSKNVQDVLDEAFAGSKPLCMDTCPSDTKKCRESQASSRCRIVLKGSKP